LTALRARGIAVLAGAIAAMVGGCGQLLGIEEAHGLETADAASAGNAGEAPAGGTGNDAPPCSGAGQGGDGRCDTECHAAGLSSCADP
jgi:hypothetical protein